MDLRRYYLENISDKEYYYKFYNLINDINNTYNIFSGIQETYDYSFELDGIDEAIEKFQYLCQPENESHSDEDKCWFYLVLYYLNKCGYVIEEFPRLVEHPPMDTYDFVNKQIRNRLISEGKDDNGTVRYVERRRLVASLTFTQLDSHIELAESIEKKFKDISNRQASFQNMSTDEKLAEIANLIENMLKKNNKFLSIDYSTVCFNYIDESKIKEYRKKLQCFRHSSSNSLEERASFTKEQKMFLIDYGLIIIKTIYVLTNDK